MFLAFLLVFFVMRILPHWEDRVVNNLRNMNVYVEYDSVENTGLILKRIRELDVQIYEVDIERGGDEPGQYPSAVFTIRLNQRITHNRVLAYLSQLECISSVEEV